MRPLLSLVILLAATSIGSAQNWTSWRADDVFHRIEVRGRCTGYNEFAGRYLWEVQLRNRYPKPIDLAWAAEPQRLHGAQAQGDHAFAVAPGETVEAHHTAPVDCSSRLVVRVNDVKPAGQEPRPLTSGGPPPAGPPPVRIGGQWQSKDAEPYRKTLSVQVHGDSVTGVWSSPGFSFQVTTPLPKNVHASVSVDPGTQP